MLMHLLFHEKNQRFFLLLCAKRRKYAFDAHTKSTLRISVVQASAKKALAWRINMSLLNVDSICAGYGKKRILDNISFTLDSRTLVGIVGANGSGKTTLLKSICGILPHTGTCTLHTVHPLEEN